MMADSTVFRPTEHIASGNKFKDKSLFAGLVRLGSTYERLKGSTALACIAILLPSYELSSLSQSSSASDDPIKHGVVWFSKQSAQAL
ncbi:unnamed protein product [Protopolystoma xenopodis]|uniref:Uncharacterized protein n=1 Tax=Protopolystoma xenopodis TaxID=117903 RepID=A0A448WPV5_9PLAT|nr:unnamed protein product [Protopolystoma xenopodis]